MLAPAGGGMAAGLANAQAGAKELQEAVGKGVKLDKESADALITELNNGITRVNDALTERAAHGHDTVKIGSTPAAELYAPTYQKVMDDPDQGGEAALTKLKKQLEDARETVKSCVRDTEDSDAGSADGISKSG